MAPVKTNIWNTILGEKGNIKDEKAKLEKYLAQALVTPNVIVDNSVDLSMDTFFNKNFINKSGQIIYKVDKKGRGKLHTYMTKNYDLTIKYLKAFIICIFELHCPGSGCVVFDIPSNNALGFKYNTRKPTCLVHEFLHGWDCIIHLIIIVLLPFHEKVLKI